MSKSSVTRRRKRRPTQPSDDWTVLFYLCGHHDRLHREIDNDVREILGAPRSESLNIVIQRDVPAGADRLVAPGRRGARPKPELLGPTNTGDAETLKKFLLWGIEQCPARHLMIVIAGIGILDPHSIVGRPARDGARAFTICDDSAAADGLDVSEMSAVLADVLKQTGRSSFDVVGFDMSEMQFLEVAYELEGLAAVMIGAQTRFPVSGWPYDRILRGWIELLNASREEGPSPLDIGRSTVAAIADGYRRQSRVAKSRGGFTVSALDLGRLADLARSFDTFALAMIQSLGDDVTWAGRQAVFQKLNRHRQTESSYDFRELMEQIDQSFQDEARAAMAEWCGQALADLDDKSLIAVLASLVGATTAVATDARRLAPTSRGRMLAETRALLRVFHNQLDAAQHRQAGGTERRQSVPLDIDRKVTRIGRRAPETLDRILAETSGTFPARMAQSYASTARQADQVRHLAELARKVLQQFDSDGQRSAPLVIARYTRSGAASGLSRREQCGVALFRPTVLDELLDSNYLRLNFSSRVHWSVLLGAVNLIQQHPRALWSLVSSMLVTAEHGAREDLLRRLIGPDSVVTGFSDQFKALAPPPRMTLSLEPVTAKAGADIQFYRCRLESSRRDATIIERDARVNQSTIRAALEGLNSLLRSTWINADDLGVLESLGRLLGEDIVQDLTDVLEQERAFAGEHDLHLQLQLPRDLMPFPWELMHDRLGWLSERYALGRQVFTEQGAVRWRPRRRSGPVRAFVIGDPPLNANDPRAPLPQLLGARAEADEIASIFEQLEQETNGTVEFDRRRDARIGQSITRLELRDILRRGEYDIIHFAGHAAFVSDEPECSSWVLSDGRLWAQEIRNTLSWCDSPPWLVYANACESSRESGTESPKYLTDVFGLATAFINKGVAAYIGPSWEIDDTIAVQLASQFYRSLILDRTTLGEALRGAKAEAKRRTIGDRGHKQVAISLPQTIGLSWCSVVLYGDPTATLLQRLGAPANTAGDGIVKDVDAATRPSPGDPRPAAQRSRGGSSHAFPLQLAPMLATQAVRGPRMRQLPAGPLQTEAKGTILELVERHGIRHWQRIKPSGEAVMLKGSPVAAAIDAVHHADRDEQPGRNDNLTLIGRWLIEKQPAESPLDIVTAYDRQTVAAEGLVQIGPGLKIAPADARYVAALDARLKHSGRPLLVIMHGTFSKAEEPISGLGWDFLEWARTQYEDVVGFDHWTLSKTPEQNARDFARMLPATLATSGQRIDIVAHSRGGLVARAFALRTHRVAPVRRVVLVGTPNAGTALADPSHWGTAADILVNLLHLDSFGLFGRLSSMLALLVAARLVKDVQRDVPGLWAQATNGSFLNRLNRARPNTVRYSAVTTNYQPRHDEPHIKWLLQEAQKATEGVFFKDYNDLVVNTRNVYSGPAGPDKRWLPADRVLLFNPPGSGMSAPREMKVEALVGVHHTNIFAIEETRDFIAKQLRG